MTCKNCLHYEACCEMAAAFGTEEINILYANKCEDFANRSEWVHLPCSVGDIVWYITGIGNNLIKPAIVKEIIIDGRGIKDLYVYGNGQNFEKSFDIFYLTREEAEKVLEKEK